MLKLISRLEKEAEDLQDRINCLYNKQEIELPQVNVIDIEKTNILDQAKTAFESLQLQLDSLLPLLQESGVIEKPVVEKSVYLENPTPKKVSFKEKEIGLESIGLSSLGMELISDRFSSNSISTFYSDSESKLEPEYNLLDAGTRQKISLNYFNETVQEINELLEDKKFLGKQDGFTIEELQESSKQNYNSLMLVLDGLVSIKKLRLSGEIYYLDTTETVLYRLFEKVFTFPGSKSCSNNNTIVVFDNNGSFYDLETGKKSSEFEIEKVVLCEWIQKMNNTVYLRLNQSLLIRQIKIEAKKLDLFDNQLIVVNDKIHLYSLLDLDFLLIFSKKKQLLDEQTFINRLQTELKLYEKQLNSLDDKLPLKTKLEWKKQYLYGQTKLDSKVYLPIQRNISSINTKILSIITEIMDLYFEIKNTIAEMSFLTKLKKIDYKPKIEFVHDFINLAKSIKGKSNFLLYLSQNEIVEPETWFLEYQKPIEFSVTEYDLHSDHESRVVEYPGEFITCINGTVYSYTDKLHMTSIDGTVTSINVDKVVDLDWYNGPVILTETRVYYYNGELQNVLDFEGGIEIGINQQKNVMFILKNDYTLELYDIETE
ncbi:hypothetical protein HDV06_005474 [Boothiomyces sp. JEL0866]|nr:hypothetical protein HDV06_005474 [Boothiomyces sp. JEL0866]